MDNERLDNGFKQISGRQWGWLLFVCWSFFACSLFVWPQSCFAQSELSRHDLPQPGAEPFGTAQSGFRTALIVSQKIRPYVQVVEGIVGRAGQSPNQVDLFFLSGSGDGQSRNLKAKINGNYDLITAVGPEAAHMAWSWDLDLPRMYTAVLDTTLLDSKIGAFCGIPLQIPIKDQLAALAQKLPAIKRIGLLHDPRHNAWFFEQAKAAALDHDITIIPLAVDSRSRIPAVIKAQKKGMDAIWMIPDQTIISEKIIYYVIKQGLLNRIGVIGYNSFFSRSGALFSFEFDYKELGIQAGEHILAILNGQGCSQAAPLFHTVVNPRVAQKLGLEVRP